MCYQWMTPFAKATQEKGEIQIKHFVDVPDDDMHNIQSHVVDLELLVCRLMELRRSCT